MKLSKAQLRSLINEALGDGKLPPGGFTRDLERPYEPESIEGVSEDDKENASNAEYGLDSLSPYFNTPKLNEARKLVMRRLHEIFAAGQ